MFLNSSLFRRITPLSLALLLAACTDKSTETDSGLSAGSMTDGSSGTTAVVPTTGGTDAGATGGMSGTTAEPDSTTVEPDSTTVEPGTSTGGDAEIGGLCMDVCEHIFKCVIGVPGTLEDCQAGCIDEWGTPECGQAGIDLLQCMEAMNCKQLQDYIEDDKPGMCGEAAAAADAVCGEGSGCTIQGVDGDGGPECSMSRMCGDGVLEAFECDGMTCTCAVDGEPSGSCEDVGVCPLNLEEQMAAGEACCGWDWS